MVDNCYVLWSFQTGESFKIFRVCRINDNFLPTCSKKMLNTPTLDLRRKLLSLSNLCILLDPVRILNLLSHIPGNTFSPRKNRRVWETKTDPAAKRSRTLVILFHRCETFQMLSVREKLQKFASFRHHAAGLWRSVIYLGRFTRGDLNGPPGWVI